MYHDTLLKQIVINEDETKWNVSQNWIPSTFRCEIFQILSRSSTSCLNLPFNSLPNAPESKIPFFRRASFLDDPFKKSRVTRIYFTLLVVFENWFYQRWNLYMNSFKCLLYLQNQISSYLDSIKDNLFDSMNDDF